MPDGLLLAHHALPLSLANCSKYLAVCAAFVLHVKGLGQWRLFGRSWCWIVDDSASVYGFCEKCVSDSCGWRHVVTSVSHLNGLKGMPFGMTITNSCAMPVKLCYLG